MSRRTVNRGAVSLGSVGLGLPGPLPEGEHVLWQGRPSWRALARDALHVRGLAAYMGVLLASVGVAAWWSGGPVGLDMLRAAPFALAPVVIVLAFAWLSAWSARYVITNKRVIMRVGAALPITVNLPFARVASAGLRTRGETGEIELKLTKRDGLSSVMLWPHARMGRARPVLRGLRDADRAGQVLARALAASVDAPVVLAPAARVVDTIRQSHGATVVAA